MNSKFITHIVPALPPQIDGVGDYALHLARHLRDQYGVGGRFIVCDPAWEGPSRIETFGIRRLRLRNEAGIWSQLAAIKEEPAVLLHYVGYGFQKRGVPVWLYRGIHSWLHDLSGPQGGRKQFSTVFHETWATSAKPWKSAFYLRILQKWLVEGFHRHSGISITSTRCMQGMLDRIEPHKTLLLPIPSNVPMVDSPRVERGAAPLRVAIFGQHWSRSATIRAHTNLLRTLNDRMLLARAVLVGKGLGSGDSEDVALLRNCVSRERVEILGELSPEKVSDSLSSADLFLSHYRGEWACKSGSFMAALAAGCPAVLSDGANSAPLREGEHFVASNDSPTSVERIAKMAADGDLDRVAMSGRSWYERNADWKVITRRFIEAHRPRTRAGCPDVKTDRPKAWVPAGLPADQGLASS